MSSQNNELYGLMAEFSEAAALVEASKKAYQAGYRKMDAYTPFPIEDLSEAVGFHKTRLPLIVLIGAITGALLGFGMQYYAAAVSYPLNIGGRPLNSWPSFIPITFELTILVAAFAAVMGMFALNGLPQPYHPVFNVPRFAAASRDTFFLCIECLDGQFDLKETREFMQTLNPRGIFEVDP